MKGSRAGSSFSIASSARLSTCWWPSARAVSSRRSTSARAGSRPPLVRWTRDQAGIVCRRGAAWAESCWSATDLLSNPRAMPCSRASRASARPRRGRAEKNGFPGDRDGVVPDRLPLECTPDVQEDGPGELVVPGRERPQGHEADRRVGVDVQVVEQRVGGQPRPAASRSPQGRGQPSARRPPPPPPRRGGKPDAVRSLLWWFRPRRI